MLFLYSLGMIGGAVGGTTEGSLGSPVPVKPHYFEVKSDPEPFPLMSTTKSD